MVEVKNLARGPRTVEEKVGENGVRTRTLMPGETAEVELINPQDPVLLAMVESRELDVGGGMRTRRSVEADHEKVGQEAVELEKQLAELRKKQSELETQLNAPRFAADPKFRSDRAAAMAAGHAPGYSDGPLPGAEPGPESEDALKRMHLDPKAAAEANPAQGGIDALALRPGGLQQRQQPRPGGESAPAGAPERSEPPKGPPRK